MTRTVLALLALLAVWPLSFAQQPPPVIDYSKMGRGHKDPANLKELVAESWKKHGKRLSMLPHCTAPKWDCRDLGLVNPVRNQGSCGSCWDVSACQVLDAAFIKAGYFKNDGSKTISDQYILDMCGPRNGGCNGDDASTVTTWARDHGIPLSQEYGPYVGRTQRCKQANYTLYKIDSQGYCGSQQGVAPTQAIKDAIVQYGPISSAVAADGQWQTYRGGIIQGDAQDIDHDVTIIGWDDTKGCWLVLNSWGPNWGEKGCCWIPYGKCQIGYSALWVHATPIDPPPPNPPVPPTPGNFTPPFFLFWTGGISFAQDQASAMTAAQTQANACQCSVNVKDSKMVDVATVTPATPPPPPSGDSFTITKTGTYRLVSPATAKAISDSGLTIDEYVQAAETVRAAFRKKQTAEPPCCAGQAP